jgi:cytoskeleton protein RodZ
MKHSIKKPTPFVVDSAHPAPGQALRAIRLAQGISAEYVQRQLGLTTVLFDALEQDDHRRLPDAIFVKGYLRRYADLVGVRPAQVFAAYQRFLEQKGLAMPDVVEVEAYRPLMAIAGSALALLLGTSLVFGAMMGDNADKTEPEPNLAAAIVQSTPPAAVAVVPAKNQLALNFVTDSWVEVVDAEEHILTVSLQRAGDKLQLEGQPPFQITLGYGPGVEISYLDQPVHVEFDPKTFAAEFSLGQ